MSAAHALAKWYKLFIGLLMFTQTSDGGCPQIIFPPGDFFRLFPFCLSIDREPGPEPVQLKKHAAWHHSLWSQSQWLVEPEPELSGGVTWRNPYFSLRWIFFILIFESFSSFLEYLKILAGGIYLLFPSHSHAVVLNLLTLIISVLRGHPSSLMLNTCRKYLLRQTAKTINTNTRGTFHNFARLTINHLFSESYGHICQRSLSLRVEDSGPRYRGDPTSSWCQLGL